MPEPRSRNWSTPARLTIRTARRRNARFARMISGSCGIAAIACADTGTVVVLHDLRARGEREQTQALLASIVASSHDAIVSTTLDGRILSWNHGAEILYGYPAEETVGRSTELIIPDDRRNDEREIITLVSQGARLERFRTRRIRRDGTVSSVALAVYPLT